MGKIYIKQISGKKYKYERISTKRINGKVVTKDKYLGPVRPVQGLINNMSENHLKRLEELWKTGGSNDALVARVDTATLRKYAKNTVIKWCRAKWGPRPKTRKF